MLSITSGMRQWNRWLANGPKNSSVHSIQVRFHLSVNRNRWGKSMPCDKRKAVRLWQIFHSNNKKAFWHPKVNHVWALLFTRCSYLRCKKVLWNFHWKVYNRKIFCTKRNSLSCRILVFLVKNKILKLCWRPFHVWCYWWLYKKSHLSGSTRSSISKVNRTGRYLYGLTASTTPTCLNNPKRSTHKPWDSNTFSMEFFCCCDNMCWAHIRPCDELKAHNPTLFSLNGDAP